jgi:selenocysteine-specific elongation factor
VDESARTVVVGTAGHIDHGKSALVQALTGIDPDRLPEEKTRGISIDLGFASTTEAGVTLSFVDVPGHERFVRTMLAGTGGVDLVMLVVAADESVMPQTREHFAICRLLHVRSGLVVLTKADLVDQETLDLVRLEVQDLVAGSFLDGAPVLAVSARTGLGLDTLRCTLAETSLAIPTRAVGDGVRLPIDRAFAMRGHGTVVTGTLAGGRITEGQSLTLLPGERPVKVRGLQVHGVSHGAAMAGQRVAVNLTGIDAHDVARGHTLADASAVIVTRRTDVTIELLTDVPNLRHGARVRFHQGTQELGGRVVLADRSEVSAGKEVSARLHFDAPAVLRRGDRFILRVAPPVGTIGGGVVLDPLPPRRGVRTPAGVARFARLGDLDIGSHEAAATYLAEAGLRGCPDDQLGPRACRHGQSLSALVEALEASGEAVRVGGVVVAHAHLSAARSDIERLLAEHRANHPLDEGMAREELRSRLGGDAVTGAIDRVLADMASEGRIEGRERVRLAGSRSVMTESERLLHEALLRIVGEAGLAAPSVSALPEAVAAPDAMVERVLGLLTRQRSLVRLGDLVYEPGVLAWLKADMASLKSQSAAPVIDVGFFKQRYHLTRKHAIPLLEYLDRERVTRRVGNSRQLV